MFVSFIDNHRPSGLRLTVHRIDSTFLYYSTYDSFCNTFLKKFLREALAHIGDLRYNTFRGGIAQLGERLHGMQEVRGSIPLVSTISAYSRCEYLASVFCCVHARKNRIAKRQCGRSSMVRLGGFEPSTHGLEGRCSIQLSYRCNGRDDRIRTCDPLVPNQMRYQTALHPDTALL